MRHVEARTAELGDLRFARHLVAEPHRQYETRTRVDQRHAHNIIGRKQVGARDAEHSLEHCPRTYVEELEEAAVEDDAGWIALAPLNGECPAVDDIGHNNVRYSFEDAPSRDQPPISRADASRHTVRKFSPLPLVLRLSQGCTGLSILAALTIHLPLHGTLSSGSGVAHEDVRMARGAKPQGAGTP